MRSLEELIRSCAERGDAADWEEFVSRFHSLIASVVLRTIRHWAVGSPALVDDLIQETYLKICRDQKRLLSEFTPHHPEAFYGFLKVVASNVVHDHFRGQHARKRGMGQDESGIDESCAPAARRDGADDIHREILLKEVDEVLRSISSSEQQRRDRAIFWLYYRFGLTAVAIGRLPSIALTVKGVESVIHRLTANVRDRLAERELP